MATRNCSTCRFWSVKDVQKEQGVCSMPYAHLGVWMDAAEPAALVTPAKFSCASFQEKACINCKHFSLHTFEDQDQIGSGFGHCGLYFKDHHYSHLCTEWGKED